MFSPRNESVEAAGQHLLVRWYCVEDVLILRRIIERPDGPGEFFSLIRGENLRRHPEVLRLVAQAIAVWNLALRAEGPAAMEAQKVPVLAGTVGNVHAVWRPESRSLIITCQNEKGTGRNRWQHTMLYENHVIENPAVLRVLSQVVKIWEGIAQSERPTEETTEEFGGKSHGEAAS